VFAYAAQRDRAMLISALDFVESKTLAYLLLTAELGNNAYVDNYDDDFLHIRTPGDDDFLQSGSIPGALVGIDLIFGGVIEMANGSRYRFENGLTVLLEDGEVRTYYASDAINLGVELANAGGYGETLIVGRKNVAITTNSLTGDIRLTQFFVGLEGEAAWSHEFWISDGYFLQDYGGGDLEFFSGHRVVGDDYYDPGDLAQDVNRSVQRWIVANGTPHDQYARLREYAEQQRFRVPVLGIEGDIGVLEQILWLVTFVLAVLQLHSAVGFFAYSEKEQCSEPWIVLSVPVQPAAMSWLVYLTSALGFVFYVFSLAFPVFSTRRLSSFVPQADDVLLPFDTGRLAYPIVATLAVSTGILVVGLWRQRGAGSIHDVRTTEASRFRRDSQNRTKTY
jgi:hypothetical protein